MLGSAMGDIQIPNLRMPGSPRQWAILVLCVPLFVLVAFSIFKFQVVWAPFGPLLLWWHYTIGGFLLLGLVLLAWGAFRRPPRKTKWEEADRKAEIATAFLYSGVVLAFLFATIILFWVSDDITKRPDLVAILFTGAAATAAILFHINLENTRQRMERREADRRRRRDYTHKVLQEYRIDAIVQEHRMNVLHAYPSTQRITQEELPYLHACNMNPDSYVTHGSEKIAVPVIYSVSELLNFYEQLAADIHEEIAKQTDGGSLDEDLLRETIAPAVENMFRKALVQIKVHWRQDKQTYEHLRWLINHWTLKKKAEALKDGEDEGKWVDSVPYAVEQWTCEVWSEDGPDNRTVHPDPPELSAVRDDGCWGLAAYMEMTLKGLAAWSEEKSLSTLILMTKKTFGDVDGFEDLCARILGPCQGDDDWVDFDTWAASRFPTDGEGKS